MGKVEASGSRKYLLETEVADMVRLTPKRLRERRAQGLPPAWVKLPHSKRILYEKSVIEAWLAAGRVEVQE